MVKKTKKATKKEVDTNKEEPVKKEVTKQPKKGKKISKKEEEPKMEIEEPKEEQEEIEEIPETLNDPKTRIEKTQAVVDNLSTPSNKAAIYVGHLPWGFGDVEIKKYFQQFGEITRIIVPKSSKSGRSVGYAFIEFKEQETAEVAAKTMNNYLLFDKILQCNVVEDKSKYDRIFLKWKKKFKFNDKRKERLIKQQKHPKTKEEVKAKIQIMLDREEKRKEKFKELGIDYSFDGFKEIIDEYKKKNGLTKESKRKTSEEKKGRKQSAEKEEKEAPKKKGKTTKKKH